MRRVPHVKGDRLSAPVDSAIDPPRRFDHVTDVASYREDFRRYLRDLQPADEWRSAAFTSAEDGLAHVFAVNVLAPYLLTALIGRTGPGRAGPGRLVYLSSGMHRGGDASLDDPQWERRRWNGAQAYADSKLFDTVLAFAVARRWPGGRSNAVEPGWVPTRMGGPGAPDDMSLAPVTQAWLAVSDDPAATGTGGYFYHQQAAEVHPAAQSVAAQDGLLQYCEQLTGTALPG